MANKAQSRYETTLTTKKLHTGQTVYKPARPRTLPTDLQDTVVTIDANDRGDIIATNVYGSPLEWWRLAAANKKTDGSLFFTPGDQIIIPRNK